jgi:glutamate dehydrogenase/leucine dehydrogenase
VIVQGWGNVASTAGYYLARKGARIVGIIDRATAAAVSPKAWSADQVRELFLEKNGQCLGMQTCCPSRR